MQTFRVCVVGASFRENAERSGASLREVANELGISYLPDLVTLLSALRQRAEVEV